MSFACKTFLNVMNGSWYFLPSTTILSIQGFPLIQHLLTIGNFANVKHVSVSNLEDVTPSRFIVPTSIPVIFSLIVISSGVSSFRDYCEWLFPENRIMSSLYEQQEINDVPPTVALKNVTIHSSKWSFPFFIDFITTQYRSNNFHLFLLLQLC